MSSDIDIQILSFTIDKPHMSLNNASP